MEGRLSNSALLRQIIPKVKPSIDGPAEEKEVCSIRTIQPVELIAAEQLSKKTNLPMPQLKKEEPKEKESKITNELIDKLNKLKESSEFDNIVKGAKLGLTAYQKPRGGIPKSDLSLELRQFINNTEVFINRPSLESLCFGQVEYNQAERKINFYSPLDTEKTKVLGFIDVKKFPGAANVDKILSFNSNNAIANSTITQKLQDIKDLIPVITVSNETLNIENE